LFAGAATPNTRGGYLFHFKLTRKSLQDRLRRSTARGSRRRHDAKNDLTESKSLLFGTDFGVGTDVETGPNRNLFVVSLSHGAVYEIFRR